MGFSLLYDLFLVVATLVALWALAPLWGEENTLGQTLLLLALTFVLVGILTGFVSEFLVEKLTFFQVPLPKHPGEASYLLVAYIFQEGVKLFRNEITLSLAGITDAFVSSFYILHAGYKPHTKKDAIPKDHQPLIFFFLWRSRRHNEPSQ